MMRRAILTLAAAILAACATEPKSPSYSLAGHWYVTGSATFDFVAHGIPLSDLGESAAADSASMGMAIQAAASGGNCWLLRYQPLTVSGEPVEDGGTVLRISCGPITVNSPNGWTIFAEHNYATLPDTVRAFTAAGLTAEVR